MKKSSKTNPASIKSRSRYVTREQAAAILEFLERPELPAHDSPFKLYFNGKLIASASAIAMTGNAEKETKQTKTKTDDNESN